MIMIPTILLPWCVVNNIWNKLVNRTDLFKCFFFPIWISFILESHPVFRCSIIRLTKPAPGCYSLPPPPRSDWQLSIVVNHLHQGALTCCSVLGYQMVRQMTSPWPHYTRTHKHNGAPTKQTTWWSGSGCRCDFTVRTPQMAWWTWCTAISRLAIVNTFMDNI